jgi:hypothetical protein
MAGRPFDWDYPRALLLALAVVMFIALIVVASSSTAAFSSYNTAWDGASDLRESAQAVGTDATVIRTMEPYDGPTAAAETVAFVLAPREPYSPNETARLRQFLQRGGTLVVADDFDTVANPLLDGLGANSRINGTLLRDERHMHQGPTLPVANNVSLHPLTTGVDSVTLNHASAVAPNGATVLVGTSGFAYADRNRNGQLDDTERLDSYPVITVESAGAGTLIVAGDPSLFINVMVERPGNAAFVRNLFAGPELVLLDYSHAGGLPPLSVALLMLRSSLPLQLLVGLLGLGVIAGWSGGLIRLPSSEIPSTVLDDRSPDMSQEELVAYLSRRHPDWEPARVRRIVRGVLYSRTQSRPDE